MINIRSVRFRLTLWYSGAFFVAMAIIFSLFYFLTQQTLYSHVDNAISSHSNSLSFLISQQTMTSDLASLENPILSRQFGEMPGMILYVSDAYGKVFSKSQNLGPNEKTFTDLLEKSTNIIQPVFTNRDIGNIPIRLGIFPVRQDNQTVALILMGQPTDVIQKSLDTLRLTLILIYVVLFFPTIIGGFLLARGAMVPITDFSTTIKKINERNLNERIRSPHTHDEIEELGETFNNLLDRLHGAFSRERQFIGDVAHELKTPLATMRTGVEVTLSKKRSIDDYQKTLGDTLVDIDKLSATITNVLDLAWAGAQNSTLDEKFSLSDLMKEIRELTVEMAGSKKIKVIGTIEKSILISGKKDKLFRAILNLVDNAVKYTHSEGTISISLKRSDSWAVIKISDNGVGIAGEDLPHVFDRFYRGAKTDKVIGSGLGLAIASSIISTHRGTINIESELMKGTDVTVNLPV